MDGLEHENRRLRARLSQETEERSQVATRHVQLERVIEDLSKEVGAKENMISERNPGKLRSEEATQAQVKWAQEFETQEMIIQELCEENIKLLGSNREYRSQKAQSMVQTRQNFYDTRQDFQRKDPPVDISAVQRISKSNSS